MAPFHKILSILKATAMEAKIEAGEIVDSEEREDQPKPKTKKDPTRIDMKKN